MLAFLLRFLNEHGEPTGWHGAVSASSYKDLFWLIDEFGDPYACEISRIDRMGICFQTKPDPECEGYLNQDGDTELSQSILINDSILWKKPDWKKLLNGTVP